jgi:hypothetical protein
LPAIGKGLSVADDMIDNKILDWLRQGPDWIRYATELQLMGLKPEVKPVLEDPRIREIVARLKDQGRGLPAVPRGYFSSDEYENPYWDLFFLADLGLKASELDLSREIETFLQSQSSAGTYLTESGMQPAYFCKSLILLSAVARLGYRDDPHLARLIKIFLSSQRLDGGWYCNPNHDIGAVLQYEPSCPQDNLNILLLLGQYAEYRKNPRFNGAIDLLLKHWEMRDSGTRIVYFGVGKRYQALEYPATRYGILRVLDALSLFPYSLGKASFRSMLSFVQRKAIDGKYRAESRTPYTDLEPAGQSSRLITFIVSRIDQRSTGG